MSDHIADTRKMVEGEDPCAGCVKRSAEGVYAMECFGCRRYYGHTDGADLYSAPRLPLLEGPKIPVLV